MHTPTTALAWELWCRNRRHVIFVVVTLLFFIFAYPMLCGLGGFDTNRPDASDEFARHLADNIGKPTPFVIVRILAYMFLAGGPAMAMVLTLLYVVWIFAFTAPDPKTKDPLAFAGHLFNLPVSTSFLFSRIILGGIAGVLGLYALWIYCVHLPHFPGFTAFQNGFGWLTLLVLGQAIVWSLAAWPFMRGLTLITAGSLYIYGCQGTKYFGSPFVLLPIFVLGLIMARAGLQKMRHGQWQGWNWPAWLMQWTARAELRGPRQFSSPARAQLWFEWRRSARALCVVAILLVLVPLAALLIYVAAGHGPVSAAGMDAFGIYLIYMPPFLSLIFGISMAFQLSQGGKDQFFVLVHPLSSGELVMSMLKAAAITTLLIWATVLAALAALEVMPWVGNFHEMEQSLSPLPGVRILIMTGLMLVSWRLAVVNLCFGSTGNRWLSHVPVLMPLLLGLGVVFFQNELDVDGTRRDWFFNHMGEVVASLLAVKSLLAGAAFSACLRRRLLTSSVVARYLTVWALLVAGLLAALLLLAPPLEKDALLPACLGLALLVPLARIGLAPLALAWSRHAK